LKRVSPGLIVVLVATAAVHLAVAVQDFSTLARNGFLYDDSFYAFQIARNIAHGEGATFDRIHPTSGFQPLYVGALVPLYWIAGDNDTLPVHLALVVAALLTAATGYLLYRLIRRRAGDAAALIAVAAWGLSPVVIRQAANGLETSLALFLFALSVTYYLERVRSAPDATRRNFVVLGIMLGLATLARVDLGFLALAMCLDYLFVVRARLRSEQGRVRWGRNLAAATAMWALMCAPWVGYALNTAGTPVPEGGRATRYLAIAYAPFFDLATESMIDKGPDAGFIVRHLERSFETLKVTPALHPVFRGTRKIATAPVAGEAIANTIGILIVASCALWWWRRRRTPWGARAREFEFLLVFGAMMIAAYSTYVFGSFFFLRYYYPLYFVGMIFAGLAIDDGIGWIAARSRVTRRLALAGCGAYAAALLFMGFTSAFRSTPVYCFYDVARWVESHTDPSDTIGVFQGGAIGYLSNRRVVNLDGKVNGEAYDALRAGRLADYVRAANIDVVMDNEPILEMFLGPWSDEERARIARETVLVGADCGAPGWLGYRVAQAGVINAGTATAPSSRLQPGPAP
jgi:4-amino-4-deoxy-L-arabinose transferase-like glycosyltransferase